MNILVTINDNYMKPLQVMLASLFRHETEPMDVYLIHSSVSKENLDLLDSYILGLGGRFISVFARESMFENAPVTGYFSKEMYYRLLCGELLPETLERVLYLDPDILIRGRLDSFYEMDFQGNAIIGVSDGVMAKRNDGEYGKRKKELRLSADDIYINSGVLLLNLQEMRKPSVKKEIFFQLKENREILRYPDQDIISLVFRKNTGIADAIYNYRAAFYDASDFLEWIFRGQFVEKPRIVHYLGSCKPWHANYIGKYYFEYRSYYRKLESGKERFMFALKRPLACALEFGKGALRVLKRNGKAFISKS